MGKRKTDAAAALRVEGPQRFDNGGVYAWRLRQGCAGVFRENVKNADVSRERNDVVFTWFFLGFSYRIWFY